MKKQVYFKVAITEMYPRIPWELVADPTAQHAVRTTALSVHRNPIFDYF